MRKGFFIALMTIVMVSCSNDELGFEKSRESNISEMPNVSVVAVYNGKIVERTRAGHDAEMALCFEDTLSLNAFIEKLSDMSDSEKINTVRKLGVSTMHDLQRYADDELEKLGNEALSEIDFYTKYEKYRQKYNGILLQNSFDKSDLNLYAPDGDNIKSYICNINGIYVVGNKVCKEDLKEKLPRVAMSLATTPNTETIPTNSSVFSPKSGKKVYLETYLTNTRMHVRMYCRKKMWYGWKNDPARYFYFDPFITSDFVYLSIGQNGQEVISSRLPRYVFKKDAKDGFDILLGRINSGTRITGQIYGWTDMTQEYDDAGKEETEVIDGMIVPKCITSKAQIINVDLNVK